MTIIPINHKKYFQIPQSELPLLLLQQGLFLSIDWKDKLAYYEAPLAKGILIKVLVEERKINSQIDAPELRVVDSLGVNIGVVTKDEALKKANEVGLDLVLVSEKAKPPIAKIIDYGKFLYSEKKKEGKSKGHTTETKTLQVKIGTGEHDLSLKAKKASKFLSDGNRVKIDLFLRGRAKYMNEEFLKERLDRILKLIETSHKIADGPKKSPKGLTIIIEKDKK